MNVLLIHESCHGNTAAIAGAVASVLGVPAIPVADAPATLPGGTGLLVVGAPTHSMGLPTPQSREQAVQAGATIDPALGLAEWLAALPSSPGCRAVAFDTSTAAFLGTAAKAATKKLKGAGFRVAKPISFKVLGMQGPLAPGELERAATWAAGLVTS